MTDVFVRVLSISVSGALVALIAMALLALFGRKLSRTFRYYIWLIVLIRLVVPLAPQGTNLIDVMVRQSAAYSTAQQPYTSNNLAPPHGTLDAPADEIASLAPLAEDSPQTVQNETPAPPVEPMDFGSILHELWQYAWVLWLGASMMLMVRAVTSYHSFARFIRAGWQPADDPEVLDLLDEVCAQYGVKRPLPLYLNPLAASPMLVGIARPVIVLPDCQLEKEKLRYILAHELIHHKRRDIVYKWFVQIVCCLHWFNPVVYLMKNEIAIACELSCDERVLSPENYSNYRQYGDTLLSVMKTSGNYGDNVASVTMSEEGKMMKKRLQSIALPHVRSKSTAVCSIILTVMLLFGASYAGAYTGMPTAEEPAPMETPITTPGEKLDALLSHMDEFVESVDEQAQVWSATIVEDITKWAQTFPDALAQLDFNSLGETIDYDDIFSSYHAKNRTIINEGFYVDGYIIHLKYDSSAQAHPEDVTVLEKPAVRLGEEWSQYGGDTVFIASLQSAVDEFVKNHSELQLRDGILQLVNVYGPYDESPDALLKRFYQEGRPGEFVAVLNSGKTSEEQREELLYKAAVDGSIVYFSILLDDDSLQDKADELLKMAYDNRYFTIFHILLDYAGPEIKQSIMDQAISDGRSEILMCIEEAPSAEAIETMIDNLEDLDTSIIAMVTEYLTEEQAYRIAATAYEQDNVEAFSIVMELLSDEEIEEFYERSYQDRKEEFFALTMF